MRRDCSFFRVDGEVAQLLVQASSPLQDAGRIASLFDERLTQLQDDWDAGFGFDLIQLSVLRSDALSASQEDLIENSHNEAESTHLVDRLSARLGEIGCRFTKPWILIFLSAVLRWHRQSSSTRDCGFTH